MGDGSCGPFHRWCRRSETGLLAPHPLGAGALEHLAVFLLAHALTALLDKRSHDGQQGIARRVGSVQFAGMRPATTLWAVLTASRCAPVAGSSTGRTPDFGSGGCRFETCPASQIAQVRRCF